MFLRKSLLAPLLLTVTTAATSQPHVAVFPSLETPHLRLATKSGAKCGEQMDTVYVGKQLGNITWDFPPSVDASSTCCSVASSYARQRSKNSTKGIAWTSAFLGPSKTRAGQSTYLCVAYDYGDVKKSGEMNFTLGLTPRLPPLPPLPPTPPKCETFKGRDTCPLNRCYWTDGAGVPPHHGPAPLVGCLDSPPISCGDNTPSGADNGPLCIHLRVNDSEVGEITGGQFFNVTVNKNATIKSDFPAAFRTDLWLSIGDGEYHKPEPHLQPFQFCVQYEVARKGGPQPPQEAVAVCITLTGAYDLQVATTKRITYAAEWHSQNPFVAQVTIGSKQ